MKGAHCVCVLSTLVTTFALAQTNPVPFVNQPVLPSSVAPGGSGFTLTVNGTGFVSGSVVDWNGTPKPTTYVSNSQLRATVSATQVANPETAWIAVVSPSPGGGTSNVAFVQISNPGPVDYTDLSSIVFYSPAGYPEPFSLGWSIGPITADFNNDRKLDLLVFDVLSGSLGQQGSADVLLGNGDGTFNVNNLNLGTPPIVLDAVALGDFNGDGKTDVVFDGFEDPVGSSIWIMLGNGDGTFQSSNQITATPGFSAFLVGDFNGDGKLDFVGFASALSSYPLYVYLGNGDGTFRFATYSTTAAPCGGVGDYNGDGKLDLLECGSQGVGVAAGNGDGTFQNPSTFHPIGFSPNQLAAYDLNGDGKLDLVAVGGLTVAVLLGNGDGTFQEAVTYPVCSSLVSSTTTPQFVVSDFNSDGKLDLAVFDAQGDSCISLGNGDGTFQAFQNFATLSGQQAGTGVVEGDFNRDGRPDLAAYLGPTTNASNSQQSLSMLVLLQRIDFNVSANSPTTVTISPGQTANYTMSINPVGGFNQTVALGCSGTPSQSTCTITPSQVTLDGIQSVQASITVVTTAPSSAMLRRFPGSHRGFPLGLAVLGTFMAVLMIPREMCMRRKAQGAVLFCLVIFTLGGLGCGGGSNNGESGGTSPGTYHLAVTGGFTSGSTNLTHAANFTLIVQ
jgi:hypothetical protein